MSQLRAGALIYAARRALKCRRRVTATGNQFVFRVLIFGGGGERGYNEFRGLVINDGFGVLRGDASEEVILSFRKNITVSVMKSDINHICGVEWRWLLCEWDEVFKESCRTLEVI